MRILVAGEFKFEIYEEAFAHALSVIGHDVRRFDWGPYLKGWIGRFESHYNLPGARLQQLNEALLQASIDAKPDVVLVFRGTHVSAKTISTIRSRAGAFLVAYNNDDPFGPGYVTAASMHLRRLWKTFLEAVPAYDMHFAYRKHNLRELTDAGARSVHLLLPCFIQERDLPVELSEADRLRYGCDVVFAGHFEPDGRLECLQALVESGLTVKLYGTGWTRSVLGRSTETFGQVVGLRGIEYTKALCGASVCLAFLSKLNRDTYTRRNFEIPATGSVMLSEYSPDLGSLFQDGFEFLSFRSVDEAITKAHTVATDPSLRRSIGAAARRRSLTSGYDVRSRMREALSAIAAARDGEHQA